MPLVQTLAMPQNGAGHDHLPRLVARGREGEGQYFIKRKAMQPSAAAPDDAVARTLWEASEALTGGRRTDYPVTLRMVQKSLARFVLIRYSYGIMQ
jgi:hypothetical protein